MKVVSSITELFSLPTELSDADQVKIETIVSLDRKLAGIIEPGLEPATVLESI